jgi:tryptophan-rich sensory protein
MSRAIIFSLAICTAGAALESLFAGSRIKQRFAELQLPRRAVPLWSWIIIGAAYYVICFAILYRLFKLPATNGRNAAFGLLGGIMFVNALWNYFFFRTRNLFYAYVVGMFYTALAVALFLLLLMRVDRIAACYLLPYILYLIYANIWGYRVWELNRGARF